MKIIDKDTGKRLKDLSKTDPVTAIVEKDAEIADQEFSPMDPPEAYAESTITGVNEEDWDECLKYFKQEHDEANEIISKFENALNNFKESSYELNDEINSAFKLFFDYFDTDLLPHNRKEEKTLFNYLQKSLLENGEKGTGENPVTAIDIMEDDHIKFIQLGALVFNFLGLAPRLRDEQSKMFTYDVAFHNGKELIELLKLHIYREENTVFPLAQKYLSAETLKIIMKEMNEFYNPEND